MSLINALKGFVLVSGLNSSTHHVRHLTTESQSGPPGIQPVLWNTAQTPQLNHRADLTAFPAS